VFSYNEYPRETIEPVRFEQFVVDGVSQTDYQWQMVREYERPADDGWADTVDASGPAFMLEGDLPRGRYVVFVKAASGLVEEAGVVELT